MSRNKREGCYAGKLYKQHWRSKYYKSPAHFAQVMKRYMWESK
jgi:hypothetical protein